MYITWTNDMNNDISFNVRCSVLQCVAVCCSVLQCVAVMELHHISLVHVMYIYI